MSRAIIVRELGGPEVLCLETQDPGDPPSGHVRVRVTAAGINFIDVYFRSGVYPRPLPFGLGLEGAGTVEAVGPDVTSLAVGNRVAWAAASGSYADQIIAPAVQLVKVPDAVTDEDAAALMLQGMTAHYLSQSTHHAQAGDRVLVHAAAGGVGLLLIQMLKNAGAWVVGTCSTADKEKLARDAGADEVIRYDEMDFAVGIAELTHGSGLDVVYDSVGQATFDGSLKSLKPRGLLVMFGQSSGMVPAFELSRLTAGSFFITRPSLGHYTQTREELEWRASEVFNAVAKGDLKVRIGARYPLEQAADAHRALEGRLTTGKVLLLTSG